MLCGSNCRLMRSSRTVASVRPPQMMCGVRPSSLLRDDHEAAAELDGGGPQLADEHGRQVGWRELGEPGDDDAAGGVGLNRAVRVDASSSAIVATTALGGTAILSTSGELSSCVAGAAVGEFDLLRPECVGVGVRAGCDARCRRRCQSSY